MKINRQNYEAAFVEYMEGTLSVEDKMEVEKFLASSPDLKHEMDAFEETVLVADSTIVFEKKNLLYRNEEKILLMNEKQNRKVIPLLIRFGSIAAAAAVILFVAFNFLNENNSVVNNLPGNNVASNNNSINSSAVVDGNDLKNSSPQNISPVVVKNNSSLVQNNFVQSKNQFALQQIQLSKAQLNSYAGKKNISPIAAPVFAMKIVEPVASTTVPVQQKKSSVKSSPAIIASAIATNLYALSGRTMAFGKRVPPTKKLRMGNVNIDLGFVKFEHHPFAKN